MGSLMVESPVMAPTEVCRYPHRGMDGGEPNEQVPDTPVTEVPDIVGFDVVDACSMVRSAGLVPSGKDNASEPSTGVVMSQTPRASTVTTVGETVFLETEAGNLAPE